VGPHHGPEAPAHHSIDAGQVGVDDFLPSLLAHAEEQGVPGHAGVGHEDLDRTEGLLDGGEG
jgi:hypothetical protein